MDEGGGGGGGGPVGPSSVRRVTVQGALPAGSRVSLPQRDGASRGMVYAPGPAPCHLRLNPSLSTGFGGRAPEAGGIWKLLQIVIFARIAAAAPLVDRARWAGPAQPLPQPLPAGLPHWGFASLTMLGP